MSNLRFNEKELISYALTNNNSVMKGPVKKMSSKSKSKYLWIVIKCNLLYVFKSESEPSLGDHAKSCYILEACYPEVTDVGFKVLFNNSTKTSCLSFLCSKTEALNWVQVIKEANFRYLRNCLVYYNSLLSNSLPKLSVNKSDIGCMNLPKKVAIIIQILGLQIQHLNCLIKIQVSNADGKCIMESSGQVFNSCDIEFNETALFEISSYENVCKISLLRTSTAAKQSSYISMFSINVIPKNLMCETDSNIHKLITQMDIENSWPCGIMIVNLINVDDSIASINKQSNRRSSCLFTETIQPLPMDEKDQLFSSVFSCSSEGHFIMNPKASLTGAPISLLHEALLTLKNNSNITISYLQFLKDYDDRLLKLISCYNEVENVVASVEHLEFRIDINQQHLKYLANVFGNTKHRFSLKNSGYQTLYFPSSLVSYRVKIMDTSLGYHEIFEKTILSAPTKITDNKGGLCSMLCDDRIKQSFQACKKFTQIRDKLSNFSEKLQVHLPKLALSLANYDLDESTRNFKDFEATSQSLISLCANADVADLVIELAVAIGCKSPLYIWLHDKIQYIDSSWSVASNLRYLVTQIEGLADIWSKLVCDFKSDLWVELLFLPCNKFQRDLLSLVNVSKSALEFKIHCIQNVSSSMNRFIMRSDAVMGQLLLAVITTFYSSIYVYMDDMFFWLQLLNVGYFIQIESLLSCQGTERILLDDLYVASELLKCCKLKIVCCDEEHYYPYFTGSRFNILINIPVSTRIYALLLDVWHSHSNRILNLIPIFCNQTIDKPENSLLVETEAKFVQTINMSSINHTKKILDKNKVFYQSIEDSEKEEILNNLVEKMKELYCIPGKPSEVLTVFQKLGKELCAGKFNINIVFLLTFYNKKHLQVQPRTSERDFPLFANIVNYVKIIY